MTARPASARVRGGGGSRCRTVVTPLECYRYSIMQYPTVYGTVLHVYSDDTTGSDGAFDDQTKDLRFAVVIQIIKCALSHSYDQITRI